MAQESEEVRCGAVRPSMKTNPLLVKPELGKVKGSLFHNPSPDHVFGYSLPPEPEGAREITMIWKEHKGSADPAAVGKTGPKPDFKAMNKLAASSGVTTAQGVHEFRKSHLVLVKEEIVQHHKTTPAPLPSEKDATFTYGMPSVHRSAEIVRLCGNEEPPMKRVVQGAYQEDWVKMNEARGSASTSAEPNKKQWVKPQLTKAAVGHSIGAHRYLEDHDNEELWKMSKFVNVNPKVTEFMTKSIAVEPESAPVN